MGNVITQNEKTLRAELQPSKAETDNPWTGIREDAMLQVRGVTWSNVRTAMTKNRSIDLTPGRGKAEILRHPDKTPAAPS